MAPGPSQKIEAMSLFDLHNMCSVAVTTFYSEEEQKAQTIALNDLMQNLRPTLDALAWARRDYVSPATCLLALLHLTYLPRRKSNNCHTSAGSKRRW